MDAAIVVWVSLVLVALCLIAFVLWWWPYILKKSNEQLLTPQKDPEENLPYEFKGRTWYKQHSSRSLRLQDSASREQELIPKVRTVLQQLKGEVVNLSTETEDDETAMQKLDNVLGLLDAFMGDEATKKLFGQKFQNKYRERLRDYASLVPPQVENPQLKNHVSLRNVMSDDTDISRSSLRPLVQSPRQFTYLMSSSMAKLLDDMGSEIRKTPDKSNLPKHRGRHDDWNKSKTEMDNLIAKMKQTIAIGDTIKELHAQPAGFGKTPRALDRERIGQMQALIKEIESDENAMRTLQEKSSRLELQDVHSHGSAVATLEPLTMLREISSKMRSKPDRITSEDYSDLLELCKVLAPSRHRSHSAPQNAGTRWKSTRQVQSAKKRALPRSSSDNPRHLKEIPSDKSAEVGEMSPYIDATPVAKSTDEDTNSAVSSNENLPAKPVKGKTVLMLDWKKKEEPPRMFTVKSIDL